MINTCPTVRIEADGREDGVIINESDFDSKTMKLWKEPVKSVKKKSGKILDR